MELIVDVPAGDDEDDGAIDVLELGKAGERGAGRALGTDPGLGVSADGTGHVSLADEQHAARDLAEDIDGERDRHPDGEAVGKRGAPVALDDAAGLPRLGHDGCVLRGNADALRVGLTGAHAEADAAEQGAVAHRHDDRARSLVELVEDLVRDCTVALVLGHLGAVLEERQAVRIGVAACLVLRRVEIRSDQLNLASELLDEGDLRLRRALRCVDERLQAEPLGCPAVAAPWLPVDAVTTASAPASR